MIGSFVAFFPMRALAAALLLCFAGTAHASFDSFSLELGGGEDETQILRAGLQWKWNKRWLERGAWHLGAYWDVQLGHWKNGLENGDFSVTPVFRYQRSGGGWQPYFEGAIGFHLLTNLEVSSRRKFSTSFQFGDHLGVGVQDGRNDWSLRLQHLSNGGISRPNPGINFLILRYQRSVD